MCVRDECRYNELLQELDPKEPEEADDWLPQPGEYDDDLLEGLLMFSDPVVLSDEEYCWEVYNGKLKPANDVQWLMITAFCRNEILIDRCRGRPTGVAQCVCR
jgi:hypothetical protein